MPPGGRVGPNGTGPDSFPNCGVGSLRANGNTHPPNARESRGNPSRNGGVGRCANTRKSRTRGMPNGSASRRRTMARKQKLLEDSDYDEQIERMSGLAKF